MIMMMMIIIIIVEIFIFTFFFFIVFSLLFSLSLSLYRYVICVGGWLVGWWMDVSWWIFSSSFCYIDNNNSAAIKMMISTNFLFSSNQTKRPIFHWVKPQNFFFCFFIVHGGYLAVFICWALLFFLWTEKKQSPVKLQKFSIFKIVHPFIHSYIYK